MTSKTVEKKDEKFAGEQTFKVGQKTIKLATFLKDGDWWEQKSRGTKKYILTHDVVKRIAKEAGLKATKYEILTQPTSTNNYQCTMMVTMEGKDGEHVELGESNRSNLGARGRRNPANMAQKRAFDRAVLGALGITGLLSEEELSDEEIKKEMDTLTIDEQRALAPMINQINLSKTKENLYEFNRGMKKNVQDGKFDEFSDTQLDYLRLLYKKKVGELQKTSF